MEFFYDQLMNSEESTMEIYWNNNNIGNNNGYVPRSDRNSHSDSVIRGILNMDPQLSVTAQWGAPDNGLLSIVSTLQETVIKSVRNFVNTTQAFGDQARNVIDFLKNRNSAGAISQDASYTVGLNQFLKSFTGFSANTPISFNLIVLPYIDKQKGYLTVNEQLETMLSCFYEEGSEQFPGDTKDDDGNAIIQRDEDGNIKKTNYITKTWEQAKETINYLIGLISSSFTGSENTAKTPEWIESLQDGDGIRTVTFKAPHKMDMIPGEIGRGIWFNHSLAVRAGDRWLFNLVLQSLAISVSNFQTSYKGNIGFEYANVSITLIPYTVLTPMDQKDYLLGKVTSRDNSKTKTDAPTEG